MLLGAYICGDQIWTNRLNAPKSDRVCVCMCVFQLALSQFGASPNAVGDMLCVRVLQAVNLRPTATSNTVNPLARVCLQLPGPGYAHIHT